MEFPSFDLSPPLRLGDLATVGNPGERQPSAAFSASAGKTAPRTTKSVVALSNHPYNVSWQSAAYDGSAMSCAFMRTTQREQSWTSTPERQAEQDHEDDPVPGGWLS